MFIYNYDLSKAAKNKLAFPQSSGEHGSLPAFDWSLFQIMENVSG